ncbi:hypothetical protein DKM05_04080 [Mycobacterium tuberculosis variant bovis]|uniref:Uncharacterized protein n=5 Tax=Mycobacterium tuberculosis complex TaxID=77643 RepID=A0A1R3XX48_MYCBO|nr:Hypothetical protein BCGMEX_1041 [Mycobacterium tuberculosis variant bovis BCG str. Mexico]AFE12299.1 hypothetical protein MRGA423_06305 [Mycobacterium tuberculosis RGTB423]AGE66994.1 hypothetical protein K60_010840 [Mycobacterium tuberculosis variant bovis BCG str. Korea 1168P]AGQ37121.1 hypothetical protein M943_05320 [Mycobacterium tuberculosis EAI5]AIQ07635.1 hypothetical protein LJ80_05485 [Mycobacterium tuberculosis]AKR00660.1 hypothetical protein Mb1595_p1137 [Mycobacterium tuberculo
MTEFLGACLGRPGVSARAEAGGSIGWRTSMPAVGPQASALAEVGGAHQSQAQKPYHDATEPLGENLRYRPAHGDSCINGHRDNPSARESSQFTAGSTAKAVTKL